MQCPVCSVPLTMSERHGIEIDYCPQCRGVWLDRGELDKIIERAVGMESPPRAAERIQPVEPRPPQYQPEYRPEYRPREHYGHHDRDYYKHKRRKNWLEELFD